MAAPGRPPVSPDARSSGFGRSPQIQFLLVVCATLLIASIGSHWVAHWVGLAKPGASYRRIGPVTGPQVFCAGSSLLQFGLAWPEISQLLNQGMENWGVGGSSPVEWEESQKLVTNVNLMIVGVSIYDLNEYHLADTRANLVPVTQTVADLWHSDMTWQFSKRVLSQYPLAYLRELLPTAGNSDFVLVGLRRKLPSNFRSAAAAEDRANALVLPKEAVLDFGASLEKLSDWPAAKRLRRLASMRNETHGNHLFEGPKHLALLRMLQRQQAAGRNLVVVLPLAPLYLNEFVTPETSRHFEAALADVQHAFPAARLVRLDRVAALQSDDYFSDPVHLNGAGRELATAAFETALHLAAPPP